MVIMKKNALRIVVAFAVVLSLGGAACSYAATTDESELRLRSVSGEIAYVDAKLGELRLEGEETQKRRYPTEFRINQEATIVTDPQDLKFLTIKDLKRGQHVTVEFNWIQGNWRDPTVATKIIAFPMAELVLQEVTGELESIDGINGTLLIEKRPLQGEDGKFDLLYFVFDPRQITVMKAPSMEPVRIVLTPGDIINVQYWVGDGARHAEAITQITAVPVNKSMTTTTTTTSTTVIKK
ncbi:MAG: hypothetical protein HQL29_03255 [Candidatus Omnitrophica bacterium]|nr:hypothetical protein [Candidatus Omnitrophota bacterium]